MLSYRHFKDPVFDPGFILIVNGYSQSHQRVLFSLPAGMRFPHVCLCEDCAVCFTPAQVNVSHGLNMPMTLCKVSLCAHCLGKVHPRITTAANYTLNTINNELYLTPLARATWSGHVLHYSQHILYM